MRFIYEAIWCWESWILNQLGSSSGLVSRQRVLLFIHAPADKYKQGDRLFFLWLKMSWAVGKQSTVESARGHQ